MLSEYRQSENQTQNISTNLVVDRYLEAYCFGLNQPNGDLFGSFLRLSEKPVNQFSEILKILRSEIAGENFCNDLIANLGIELKRQNEEIFQNAINRISTQLTVEVAEILGKKLEELAVLSPKEQRDFLSEQARIFANRKKLEIQAKIDDGQMLSRQDQMLIRDISWLTDSKI